MKYRNDGPTNPSQEPWLWPPLWWYEEQQEMAEYAEWRERYDEV